MGLTLAKINKATNYLYMFMLLALSGNPFFSVSSQYGQYAFVLLVVGLIVKHHNFFNLKKAKSYFRYIAFFCVIFLSQFIVLGFVSIPGVIGFLLKITIGYIVIKRLNINFKNVYFNLLFFVSLISVLGYLYNITIGDIPAIYLRENTRLYSDNSLRSIIVFNQLADGLRNSGMFWEPGAFACYINLAFLLYLGKLRALLKKHKFKAIVILIALITTFSTTGYFVLFFVCVITVFTEFSSKYKIITIPLAGMFIVLGFMLYQSLEFLNEKVNRQYETALTLDGDFSNTRFGALVFDWHYIQKRPLIGNGLHSSTRYADHPWLQNEEALGHGNGFSNFLASMGLLSLLYYAFLILKFNKNKSWVFLIAVLALMQGEQLLNYPLFLSLPFIFIYEKKYRSTLNVLQ